jgi:FkbM family methyltransferase
MVLSSFFRIATKILSGYGLGRNKLFARLYFGLGKRLLPEFIMFNGNKIFLDSENSINLAACGYKSEDYALSLFEAEIETGSVVLDIGANIGLYTLAAAKYAGKVYSFEPDPITFPNLKKNVEGNFYENVVIINKAVSDRRGRMQFSSSSGKSSRGGNHLVSNLDDTNAEFVLVDTIALDDFFKDTTLKIDVIKMDIEGAEFQALRGMKNLILATKHMKLFMEFNPHALNRQAVNIPSFLDYLDSLKFALYYIDERNKIKKPVAKEWLLDYSENKDYGHYINLLGMKNA